MYARWFFNLLIGRCIVRQRSLARHPELIRIYLSEAKCDFADKIPESALMSVAQEAYRRAAEVEPDQLARYGRHHEQLHHLSEQIIAALKRDPAADARVRRILEAHGVLEVQHQTSQPAAPKS
jgi:nitrogenase subunit NifH